MYFNVQITGLQTTTNVYYRAVFLFLFLSSYICVITIMIYFPLKSQPFIEGIHT